MVEWAKQYGLRNVATNDVHYLKPDDWLAQEKRGEDEGLSPLTIFYPMHRVERVERDEQLPEHHRHDSYIIVKHHIWGSDCSNSVWYSGRNHSWNRD